MDTLQWLYTLAIFVAVALLFETAFMAWNAWRGPEARRIARRLQNLSGVAAVEPRAVLLLKKRSLSKYAALHRLLDRMPLLRRLDRLLEQAGMSVSVAQVCLAMLACGVGTALVLLAFEMPRQLALAACVPACALPVLYAIGKRRKRLMRIEEQLPDALDLMGRSLRAGHALPSAIKLAGDEMADPLAGEFRILFDEINYGIAFPEALQDLAARVPGTDVSHFVVGVLIQRETGGNLAELLDDLAGLIRERLKLAGQIRVYSAEGKMSAWILGLLPFVMVAFMQMVNPEFMSLLWSDPLGRQLLNTMLAVMLVGVFWMRQLVRIRV